MRNIKYLASYNGPSYGLGGYNDRMDGFYSLKHAMESMWSRQKDEYDHVITYRENEITDVYQRENVHSVRFPATTRQDIMDVYYCEWSDEDEGYILGDWMYRITVGPRGGIRAEKA
jgi:hypothetical protein